MRPLNSLTDAVQAMDEPNYGSLYARLCLRMRDMAVPGDGAEAEHQTFRYKSKIADHIKLSRKQ